MVFLSFSTDWAFWSHGEIEERRTCQDGKFAMRIQRYSTIAFNVVWVLVILTIPAWLQSGPDTGRPIITVEFDNELVTLAKGFEEAFRKLPAGPKFAVFKTPEGPVFLKDTIRALEAVGGVGILRMRKGVIHAVNVGDVVRITNENPNSKC